MHVPMLGQSRGTTEQIHDAHYSMVRSVLQTLWKNKYLVKTEQEKKIHAREFVMTRANTQRGVCEAECDKNR